jgi:hypothetical protein
LLGERYLPSVRQSIKGVKLPTKNEASSSVFRLQGNQHFAEQRYTLALERYNEVLSLSLLCSPPPSPHYHCNFYQGIDVRSRCCLRPLGRWHWVWH